MKTYRGKSAFEGIAVGRIQVRQRSCRPVSRTEVQDTEAELERYRRAREKASEQLGQLYEKALREIGEADAAIFEAHRMLLEDGGWNEAVETLVRDSRVSAEYAVASAGDRFARMFAAMQDGYMSARAADMKDISERVIRILQEEAEADINAADANVSANAADANASANENIAAGGAAGSCAEEAVIVAAEDLAPSETVQMDKDKVLAFVTAQGSLNSHTAILARTMGIPALVGTGVSPDASWDGKTGIVDGFSGTFYVEPEETLLERMRARKEEETEKKRLLQELKGKETVTADGKRMLLYANIGNTGDLAAVLQNDAEGIGLFRSEFIYLERDSFPTEEEQFEIYKTAVEAMAGKRVIIRTLDIGADKQCGYFEMEKEENPALGCRAIRICLTRPEIFKTQLRALFRAGVYGRLAIMYPMITGVGEVKRIRAIVEEVKAELSAQGIAYGTPEQGIMIETPAAVMMSGELAREVDFFSIGTNDLTQYTLAIDRRNAKLDEFYDPHHPAVLKMIRMVVENAHRAGIWAGICGELGADRALTREFLAMGVDELSVSPESILPLRKLVRETDVEDYKRGRREPSERILGG